MYLTFKIILPLQVVWNSFLINIALPLSLYLAYVDNSDFAIVESVQAILDLARSEPTCVSFMVLSSGSNTVGSFLIFFFLVRGHCTLYNYL